MQWREMECNRVQWSSRSLVLFANSTVRCYHIGVVLIKDPHSVDTGTRYGEVAVSLKKPSERPLNINKVAKDGKKWK